jgi:uncharacterized iron-regulated protein
VTPRTLPPGVPDVYAVRGGALVPVEPAALDEAIARSRAVYAGEQHDDPHMHHFEYELLQRVYNADHSVALGIEMLPTPMQPALDDYVAGRSDEAEFLAAVDWKETWGFPFEYYRPLLELCREHGLRVVALNAPRALSRKLAHGGLEALTDEEKRALPELVPGPPAHRAQLEEAFKGHGAHGPSQPAALERFYLAQLLWDETMASTVARELLAPGAPHRMLVIAGEGHVRRFAIPDRARRRGVQGDVIVVPAYPPGATPKEAEASDFLWVLHPRAPAEWERGEHGGHGHHHHEHVHPK